MAFIFCFILGNFLLLRSAQPPAFIPPLLQLAFSFYFVQYTASADTNMVRGWYGANIDRVLCSLLLIRRVRQKKTGAISFEFSNGMNNIIRIFLEQDSKLTEFH